MKDSLGRSIDYLRISLTDKCNFRCIYCMPEEGVEHLSHDDILRLEEIEDFARIAAQHGIKKIRLTGGEPLVRKNIVELIGNLKDIPGIEDISLTTNGVLLPAMAKDLKAAGLDRVNISLDTLDPEQFRMITRCGNLESTMKGIDAALEADLNPVKINCVTVKSLNQDFLEFAKMSIDRPLHIRFIEYMPVGHSSGVNGHGWGKDDVIPSDELRRMINERAVEAGYPELVSADSDRPSGWGPATYFKFPGAKGTLGFISPLSHHFCSECNRMRLTADGKIRPCLFSDEEFSVKEALDADDLALVSEIYETALGKKPDEHHDKEGTERNMSQIGG
ncbi:MAG: GTP 3',8-cyclase MoaA [Eggerthellaceae bacterium]|nr:GTP 3',8-cyclase MoaA [Eggerthellaceae bacterium]